MPTVAVFLVRVLIKSLFCIVHNFFICVSLGVAENFNTDGGILGCCVV